jgi:hypothetical protein
MQLIGFCMFLKYRSLRIPTVSLMLLLSGCSEAESVTVRSPEHSASNSGDQPVRREAASPPSPQPTGIDETDRFMLEAAEKACLARGGGDYAQFFDAFAQSGAVRQKYSAPKIKFVVTDHSGRRVEQSVNAAAYDTFPIKIVDYYRKPVFPSHVGGQEEYVEVQFNQSQSGHFSADWTRVTYVGDSEGGDDLGKPVDLDGKPYDPTGRTDGQLLFNLVGDCWQLVADIRYEHINAPGKR